MKRHGSLWFLVGLLVLVSLACNAFAGQPVEPSLSRPGVPGTGDDTAVLPTAVIQNIAPTATLRAGQPTTVPTPFAEPVTGEPLLRALVDVNIRLGPGVAYARDSFLLKGETAVVLGYHPASGWWQIVCPERVEGNTCWVSGGSEYTRVTNSSEVESVAAPPTSTAVPTTAATAVSESSTAAITETPEAETTTETLAFGLAAAPAFMVYADADALWRLSLDESLTAKPTRLVDAENVGEILISPNGRYLVFLSLQDVNASLHLVDLETGSHQTLLDAADLADIAPSPDLAALIGQMQWLADSEALAFNTYAVDREGGPGMGSLEDLWTVNLAGTLTERFAAGQGGGSFAISPQDVVVMGQKTAVIRANLDGSNQETVISFPAVNTASEFAFYPWLQWLADGAFATAAISSPDPYTSAEADLWRIPAAGEAQFLTALEGNIIFSPVIWSDSGRQLGYVRELDGPEAALVLGA
ncbi:MAG: hypothetical protein R6X34_13315, partial [Chloroflexota bacterium]